MTKKQKKPKSNDVDQRPFRFQTLNDRLNNININVVHRIRYHDAIDLDDQDNLTRSSHFHHSLQHWSTLNFSEACSHLFRRLTPLSGSLEQVVYNREQIIDILRQALHERNPLIVETLLDVIVQLARDLQGEFYPHYKQHLFHDIVDLLLHTRSQQHEINTQLLEQVFQCLTYLFKYLWRIMLKDLASLYELYAKFLFSSSGSHTLTNNYEYIRSFAAESFAYLLRKIEIFPPFIDYVFSGKEREQNELDSLALVFSETCQNVQSTFHSCTKPLLQCLLKKLVEKPTLLQSCIKSIYALLIEHTNRENVAILWTCLMDVYRSIEHGNGAHLTYQTFYELFQLLVDHRMIIDHHLCWEFLTMIKNNDNEEFLKIHYETVHKLMGQVPISERIIDIYYRFVEQTSSSILYEETRKLMLSDLNEKLPHEFYARLWKGLLEKNPDRQQMIDYLVDYIIIERKRLQMVCLPNDHDQSIRDKIQLLNAQTSFLIKDRLTERGLEFIQLFIQDTLSNVQDRNIWVSLGFSLIFFDSIIDAHFSFI